MSDSRTSRRSFVTSALAIAVCGPIVARAGGSVPRVVPLGGSAHPLQLAPGSDGTVWFAAARAGALGRLSEGRDEVDYVSLGNGAKPKGLVAAPSGMLYAIDPAQDVIHRLDPASLAVTRLPMPSGMPFLELTGAAVDGTGQLWFAAHGGWYGRVDAQGETALAEAPGGRGPGAMASAPDGSVWCVSAKAGLLFRIRPETGIAEPVSLPAALTGARGVAADRAGAVWVAGYDAGLLARYRPQRDDWAFWRPPGEPRLHAIAVDGDERLWISDIAQDRILRFDQRTQSFATTFANLPKSGVRHLLAHAGRIWLSESQTDRIVALDAGSGLT